MSSSRARFSLLNKLKFWKRSGSEERGSVVMELLVFIVVYLLLTQWVLPKMGVPT